MGCRKQSEGGCEASWLSTGAVRSLETCVEYDKAVNRVNYAKNEEKD